MTKRALLNFCLNGIMLATYRLLRRLRLRLLAILPILAMGIQLRLLTRIIIIPPPSHQPRILMFLRKLPPLVVQSVNSPSCSTFKGVNFQCASKLPTPER